MSITWDSLLSGFNALSNVMSIFTGLFQQAIDAAPITNMLIAFSNTLPKTVQLIFYSTVVVLQILIFFGMWYWLYRLVALRVTHLWR